MDFRQKEPNMAKKVNVPTTTETKTETSSTTETNTETSSTTETIEKAKSTAKTGDNSPLAMVVALMCLAVAGILVLKDKKKKLNK